MFGPTVPGMAAEVLRADMADRTRAAEASWASTEMKREIRAANAAARAARRSTRIGAQRRRWFRWVHEPVFPMARGGGTDRIDLVDGQMVGEPTATLTNPVT